MSKLNRIKREVDSTFTTINNHIATDIRAGSKVRGIYLTVMSLPPDWDFTIRGLVSILPDGKTAVYSAINQLIKLGYCSRKYHYSAGKIEYVEYTFHQRPIQTLSENLEQGFLEQENQPQLKKQVIKETSNSISQSKHFDILLETARPVSSDAHTRERTGARRPTNRQQPSIESLFADLDEAKPKSPVKRLSPVKQEVPLTNENTIAAPQRPVELSEMVQGYLPGVSTGKTRSKAVQTASPKSRSKSPVSASISDEFARICFLAGTHSQRVNLIDKRQWARIHDTVRRMQSADIDLGLLPKFELWWASNFRSKDSITGRYQPPRPEQIREFWLEAIADRNLQPKKELAKNDEISEALLTRIFQAGR